MVPGQSVRGLASLPISGFTYGRCTPSRSLARVSGFAPCESTSPIRYEVFRYMTYLDEWRALSARIHALVKASEIHSRHMAVNSGDTYARARRLIEHGQSTLEAVRIFGDRHKRLLSAPALTAINQLLEQATPLVKDPASSTRQEQASAALLLLGLFESEISLLLTDGRATIRTHCERAFEHLRRLIVVDSTQRKLWQAAYADKELACERLGATHLLLHGIWTFKTDAAGARTDLVYSEPVDLDQAARAADGLVLTEWKKTPKEQVTSQEVNRLFADARAQARRYAEGPLAGFELTDYRYMVLVSWEDVEVPPDIPELGVLYRHISIPVAPLAPSKRRPRT
jgi:hypothetical protein